MAAMIGGSIDIAGSVTNNGSFVTDGGVTFNGNGSTQLATGDFASVPAPALGDVTLTDIAFATPGTIWEVGGFTFTATGFFGIDQDTFHATGDISKAGFDDTAGLLVFTTQGINAIASFSTTTTTVPLPAGVLLMGTALAGFGVMRRRKDKKAA
mmetsp:Transcript_8748/g.19436  ORF Transcript_8748/g.19436 Transcript_8748/m.19436 type:complete len:154 (+) Transcript_8748:134-595(+)|eukprot:CAMPEP_0181180748 /NCGR_PEP_ID=MMETSP1096-20121128/6965_1 /TAXON_ID=156174 ORGANISM="Chrysochromulina ericina, Strain CCMP281" /NCGR_SAMPLE_ID=MMETSP1096 /ASSEMBLY_ACC=CAM_ASM_000453 /LENGTH=153 /DNA_ID=CAMNT_0023269197 /DNA_START=133 /DNA_END=594 /DNA_ORIENTATION=+